MCLTGNWNIRVSNQEIIKAVHSAKENFSGLISSGKARGRSECDCGSELSVAEQLLEAGGCDILVPAVNRSSLS